MGVKRMDKIELPDWFRQEIDEVAQDLRNAQEDPMVRQGLAQTKIARLQARVAYDAGKSQKRVTRNLLLATWGLVVATLVVAVVAIWG